MPFEKKRKILIVEDDNIIAKNLKTVLQDHGYTVTGIACSGSEAVEMHQQQDPDLVIVDIILEEDMNGIEAASKMQVLKPTPIIFLTVIEHDLIIKTVLKIRSFKHILKPYKERDLINSITTLLQADKQTEENSSMSGLMKEVLDQISDGIIILGNDGKILFSNKAITNLFGMGENDLLDEALFYFSGISEESEIQLEVSNKVIPCLVRTVDLNWKREHDKMLVIKDLSAEQNYKAKIKKLKKLNNSLEKKFGVGYFRIEFTDKPKMLDANSSFIKKMQFEQFSDLHSKSFTDLLSKKKDYLLISKKILHEHVITGHKLDFIDQQGNLLKTEINAELIKPGNGPDQIKGLVFFQN